MQRQLDETITLNICFMTSDYICAFKFPAKECRTGHWIFNIQEDEKEPKNCQISYDELELYSWYG